MTDKDDYFSYKTAVNMLLNLEFENVLTNQYTTSSMRTNALIKAYINSAIHHRAEGWEKKSAYESKV